MTNETFVYLLTFFSQHTQNTLTSKLYKRPPGTNVYIYQAKYAEMLTRSEYGENENGETV